MAESTAKMRQEIMALSGVDIMASATEFKSTYAIMDELAQKWKDLTDIQQASIIELMAGKHQGNVFASLMQNFDTARAALETSLNSSGSAMAEHAKWSESLEARLNKLKAAWQSLAQSFMSSDFLKVTIDSLIGLVNILDKIISTLGTFGTIGLGTSIFSMFKLKGTGLKSGLLADLSAFGSLASEAMHSSGKLSGKLKNLGTVAGQAAGSGISRLGGSLSGVVGGIGIAVAAFGLIYNAIKNYKEEISQARQETIEASDTFLDSASTFEQAYIKYSGKTSLTAEEEAELSSAIHGATDALGDKSSALQNVVNSSDNYLKSLEAIKDAELDAAEDAAKAKKQNAELELKDTVKGWSGFDSEVNVSLGLGGSKNADEAIKIAEEMGSEFLGAVTRGKGDKLTSFSLGANADTSEIIDYYYTLLEYQERLSDADLTDTSAYEQVSSAISKMSESIETYTDGVYDAAKAQYQLTNGIPKTAEEYLKMREAILNSDEIDGLSLETKKTIASTLDTEYGKSIDLSDVTVQARKLIGVLDEFGETEAGQVETLLNMRTAVNDNECTVGEYMSKLDEMSKMTEGWSEESKEEFKLSLGLDTDSIKQQYDKLLSELPENIGNKTTKEFLNSLSANELSAVYSLKGEIDWKNGSPEEILAEIKEQAKINEAISFTFSVTVEAEGIEALNTALSESNSAIGLTAESIGLLKSRYKDLDGFNAAALFVETANGVRLNSDELERLEAQYASVNKVDIASNLNTLLMKYRDLTEEIKTCTDEQEKEKLQAQADTYADKIEELSLLASQYDGLTSALNKWQTAQSSANAGDNYNSLYENLEAIKDLREHGLVGTDDYRAAVQLMSNVDLTSASIEELNAAYSKGYPKMQRYFTEGRDGCLNFVNDLKYLNSEWVNTNNSSKWYDWEITADPKEIADKLGISVDAALSILGRAEDYGIKVAIESDYTSIDELQTVIEQNEAKLKELGGTPYPVNLTVEGSAVDTEIEKIKAHINSINNDSKIEPEMKTAQLDDARAKLEVLIQKKQEASQPAFMSLDTSQVNASLMDALEKVQAYQTALNEVNKLNELKEAGIPIDDSQIEAAKQKAEECVKAIAALDKETKVNIGLEEDGSIDSIKKAFEDGKVNFDIDTTPAKSKITQLAEEVEKIEDKDVTITVKVKGLKDVKNLNENIDLATNIEGNVADLTEYVSDAKELKELGNITSIVTAKIDGDVIDTYEYKIDNLKTFAESAEGLKDVGSFTTSVTAKVDGDVIDTYEYKINNLETYAESAKNVKEVGTVTSSVTANVEGSVFDTTEISINNLKTYVESAKGIQEVGVVESKVTANIEGNVIDEFEYKINNLKTFTDSAKDLESIGNIESNVIANIEGNVVDKFEYQINNLKTFTDNAKDIGSIGDVESKVVANIEGNVIDLPEYKINNLKKFSNDAKEIESVGNVKSKVAANIKGNVIDEFEYKINNLKEFVNSAKDLENVGDINSKVTANVEGNVTEEFEYKINNLKTFSDSAKNLEDIGTIESNVTANIEGNVIDKFEYKIDNLKVFSDSAKNLKNIGTIDSSVTANVEGNVLDTGEGKIESLKTFAESAKNLKDIGDISSKVVADVSGSVLETREGKIDNLKVFVESAKNIKSVGDVTSKVTADVSGNVLETRESKIDNLKAFTDNAKNIKSIGKDTKAKITADIEGNVIDTRENKIDNLKVFTNSAKDVKNLGEDTKAKITADVEGNVIETAEYMLDNLKVFTDSAENVKSIGADTTAKVTADVSGNVLNTSEKKLDNIGVFADNAKKAKSVGNFTSSISANVNGNIITDDTAVTDLEHFASVVSGMSGQSVSVNVTANVDSAKINEAIAILQSVSESGVFQDYNATITVDAEVNGQEEVDTLKATIDATNNKTVKVGANVFGTAAVNALRAAIAALQDKTVTVTTIFRTINAGGGSSGGDGGGTGVANGTAHANGTAFANGTTGKAFRRGDWRTKSSGVALMGELGRKSFATIHSDMY